MANSAAFTAENGDMTLAVRRLSPTTVSTLMSSCVLLAVLHLMSAQKPDEVLGVGDPTSQTVLSGAKLDPIRMQQLDQDGRYETLNQTILQSDFRRKSYRDTNAVPSAHSGTDATFTYTVVNGVVTAVAVSGGGTGYSGAAPTLIFLDALGSAGNGCILSAAISGGAVSAVTVVNGGHGYAASGGAILVNVGKSAGERYGRLLFGWSKMEHTAQVYDSDVDSALAMTKAESDNAEGPVMSVVSDAIRDQISNQCQEITNDLWYGAPSDQSATFWDQQFGLLAAIDDGSNASNVANYSGNYGGADRSLSANYWARSIVDTSTHTGWGLKDLVLDAHLKKGLAFKGGQTDLFIVDPELFARFSSELTSYTQEVNLGQSEQLREIGMYGFNKMALKYSNTYCIPDNRCPKGTAIGLNSKTLKVTFKKGVKFAPSKLYDQHGIPGGIDGSIFFVRNQYRFIIDAPMLNVKYVNVA